MDRNKIINEYSKSEFMNFLENDNEGLVLTLFDEEGTYVLKRSKLKEERISYILNYSKYKDKLLLNTNFLDVLLNSDISYYYASFNNLSHEVYNEILKRSVELNKDNDFISKLFSYFNVGYKLNILNNWPYSYQLLYCILRKDEAIVIQKIISTYNIDLLSDDIDLRSFFSKAKDANLIAKSKRNRNEQSSSEINVPSYMITKEIADKLWNKYDIFVIRAIINDASYSSDFSIVNNAIKEKERQIISSYNGNVMLSPFKEIYYMFSELKKLDQKNMKTNSDEYYDIRYKLIRFMNKFDFIDFNGLNAIYENNGLEGVFSYLNHLSERSLSNYIIDYLFEENYHNVIIDIRELLNFYYRGNIVIPKERVEIYDKISNIDLLSTEEKQELFNYLKDFNMIETFYDDMHMARYIVGEAIKEYSLSSESIIKYKDETLSKQYGVDVYNMKDNYFFGIVKSGSHMSDKLPTGHSYSLIGRGGIITFGDPKESNTYLYDSDDMNPEQLVHAYPFDSFTYYHPFEHSTNSTRRVNTLLMPDELLNASQFYNELLLLEKGTNEVGIETSIPKLKRIALYCLDEIRSQDVEVAKQNNVGIILVSSKKYQQDNSKYANIFKQDIYSYNYFNGSYEKEKFESKR